MLYIVVYSCISFFAVIGIYCLAAKIFFPKDSPDAVMTKAGATDAEYKIRAMLAKYPDCEIIVSINDSEAAQIAKKLSQKHQRIHTVSEG